MTHWTFNDNEASKFLNCNMKSRYNNIKKYKLKINTNNELYKLLEQYDAKEYYIEVSSTISYLDHNYKLIPQYVSQKAFEISPEQILPKEITNLLIYSHYGGDFSEFILKIHKKY
jgi:hypothetical protein